MYKFGQKVEETLAEKIIIVSFYFIFFSITVAGALFLFWGYRITNNLSDDGKGVYYSSSNPEIKDSIIKPIGPALQEKFDYSLYAGVIGGITLTCLYLDFTKDRRKKDDEIKRLSDELWELQKKTENIKIISQR